MNTTSYAPVPEEKMARMAKILRIISHPVRLEILRILSEYGEMDVSSICAKVGGECEFSMMSHHLAKMKDNDLLLSEKKGKQVFYRLTDPRLLEIVEATQLIS